MSKKQKIVNFIKSERVFLIVLVSIIFVLFLVLSPKVSSLLFQFKRQAILNDFINKTKTVGGISSRDYWEFREFYSPGYFTFSKDGLTKVLLEDGAKEIGINYNQKNISLSFLFFSSPLLNSLDMLTRQVDINELIDLRTIPQNNIIFKDKNCFIYKSNSNTIKIVFLLSSKEMEKVSGFSDYVDIGSIKEENWFNITSINTN